MSSHADYARGIFARLAAVEARQIETKAAKRRRMADLIRNRVTSTGRITRDDLVGCGDFSAAEIDELFHAARLASGVHRLAAFG